jgi:hypothetical protein
MFDETLGHPRVSNRGMQSAGRLAGRIVFETSPLGLVAGSRPRLCRGARGGVSK